jgi:hypothetical protein
VSINVLYRDQFFSGYGIQVWPNGNKYEGQWVNGMREGTGAFYILDSATKKHKKQYHGSWRANFKDGLGVFFYQNGDRYEGSWVHGHRTGKGSHFYASGDVYVGDWIEDQRSGWGRLTKGILSCHSEIGVFKIEIYCSFQPTEINMKDNG